MRKGIWGAMGENWVPVAEHWELSVPPTKFDYRSLTLNNCYYSMLFYILIRHLSAYTEDDIILGVFTTQEKAQLAKKEYIHSLEANGDPHKNQGYMTVNLKKDIMIESRDIVIESKDEKGDGWSVKKCKCKCQNKEVCGHKCCLSSWSATQNLPSVIFILATFSEGFGQKCMGDLKIFAHSDNLLLYAKEKEKEIDRSSWPTYFERDQVQINTLRHENNFQWVSFSKE